MRHLNIIGIGAGDPEHLTLQAIRAMNEVDVFFHLGKGEEKAELRDLRHGLCAKHVTSPYRWVEAADPQRDRAALDYEQAVVEWHEARAVLLEQLLLTELRDDEVGGLLVWGDPALYDSTLRVVQRVLDRDQVPLSHEVIPGISSVQALAARHRIPWNRTGGAVQITTGRRLGAAVPTEADDILVMLDPQCSFTHLPADTEIYWGAYVGTQHEILLAGAVGDVGSEIKRLRAEASRTHGWIMDSYLLRRPSV